MIDIGNEYFACDECGICEELEWRMRVAAERGDIIQFDHCGCVKIDDEFWSGGYCEDAFSPKPAKQNIGHRKTGRAYRRAMHRRTIANARNYDWWYGGPYLSRHWENGKAVLEPYIKYPQNSSNKQFFKRLSNKKARHSKNIPLKGNGYRRVFDYWWAID